VAVTIRPARADDGPALRTIERLAGEQFRDVGLDAVAEAEPFPLAELTAYADAGRSWVAADADDREAPIGYALIDVVDGQAHLEQVSVLPDRQGTGVGRALIDRVAAWALETGRSAVTLTTFSAVPWNRPYYERLGFRVLDETEIGPDLRRLRDTEAAAGLDPRTRVCMRLDLPGPSPAAPPPPNRSSYPGHNRTR
jgi:GNAT superfamily N-acetyltransferase